MADSWQLEILRRLRERNKNETGSFRELILSRKLHKLSYHYNCSHLPFSLTHTDTLTQLDGRLLDQVESLKKDITRLEYQNNELERVCTYIILSNIA